MSDINIPYFQFPEDVLSRIGEKHLELLIASLQQSRLTLNGEVVDALSQIGRMGVQTDQTSVNLFLGRIAGAAGQLDELERQLLNAHRSLSVESREPDEDDANNDTAEERWFADINEPVGESPTRYGRESLREELESQGVIQSKPKHKPDLDAPIGGEPE
jgi:hypothetical protein